MHEKQIEKNFLAGRLHMIVLVAVTVLLLALLSIPRPPRKKEKRIADGFGSIQNKHLKKEVSWH